MKKLKLNELERKWFLFFKELGINIHEEFENENESLPFDKSVGFYVIDGFNTYVTFATREDKDAVNQECHMIAEETGKSILVCNGEPIDCLHMTLHCWVSKDGIVESAEKRCCLYESQKGQVNVLVDLNDYETNLFLDELLMETSDRIVTSGQYYMHEYKDSADLVWNTYGMNPICEKDTDKITLARLKAR